MCAGMTRFLTAVWSWMVAGLLPVFAGLLMSGCQVAHMALPQELQSQATELTVEGRRLLILRDSIRFGPYHVTDIHQGWTRGGGFSISLGDSEFSISEAKKKYEFSVEELDRHTWAVQCATMTGWTQLETEGFLGGRFGVEFLSNQQLVCALKQEGSEKLFKLVMTQSSASAAEAALQGTMTDGATRIDISSTHALDTTPLPVRAPTGHVFRIEARPVGAVEVINKGVVWLDNSVTPATRSALAATSAALLLHQDIKSEAQNAKRMSQ
jgi:hypothetical protein